MDSYQAVYDAVRSKISGCNVGEIVREAAERAFDVSNILPHLQQEIYSVSYSIQRPHVLMRPSVYPDGNKWCVLYGDDLQNGVAGFGDTPEKAMADFDNNWTQQKAPPSAHKCARCGEPNPDKLSMDGCRAPDCPETGLD